MILSEDSAPIFQTAREKYYQKELVKLLRKNHHNKYADRLDKSVSDHTFFIKIVPLQVDPNFTAAMDDENLTIRVGEGFVVDCMPSNPPEKREIFNQLDVIIRHEIAHFYLRHQKRFAKRFPEYDRLRKSNSLFDFLNIVADDEISNTRYTDEDKKRIRQQKLNGAVLGGLITEDHREAWKKLNLEQMMDLLEKEIEEDNEKLINGFTLGDERLPVKKRGTGAWNPTTAALLNAYNAYVDINSASSFPGKTLAEFGQWIDDGCWVQSPRGKIQIADEYRDLIKKTYESGIAEGITDADVTDILQKIAKSKITQKVLIFSGSNQIDLYTPEEKYIGEETIKKFRSKNSEWYTKVLDFLRSKNPDKNDITDFWKDSLSK